MRKNVGKNWSFYPGIKGFRKKPLTPKLRKEMRERYHAMREYARIKMMPKPRLIVTLPVTRGMYLVFEDYSWRKLA